MYWFFTTVSPPCEDQSSLESPLVAVDNLFSPKPESEQKFSILVSPFKNEMDCEANGYADGKTNQHHNRVALEIFYTLAFDKEGAEILNGHPD